MELFSDQSYKIKEMEDNTMNSYIYSPSPRTVRLLPPCLPLCALPASLGCVSFSPGLWQHAQKAVSGLVAISYCSNPPDRRAVDKPGVKAARRPDWWASRAPAELGIPDRRSVLHEFTAVLADKGGFCSVAFLILKGRPNFLLFRRKGCSTHRVQSNVLFVRIS